MSVWLELCIMICMTGEGNVCADQFGTQCSGAGTGWSGCVYFMYVRVCVCGCVISCQAKEGL